jgi:hypothetical protein
MKLVYLILLIALFLIVAFFLVIAFFLFMGGGGTQADAVFLNGKILTVDKDFNIAEAVAVKGNRILRVGSDGEIKKLAGPKTRVVNLRGRAVLPGFEDSHIHFLSLAAIENQIDLSQANNIQELTDLVKEKDASMHRGFWILGRGWDQERMEWDREYGWPTKEDLDFTDKPVLLFRICGHIAVANSKALEIAGMDKNTEVEGGIIDRYSDGEPTGVLREKAIDLITSEIPVEAFKPSLNDLHRMTEKALANGITCIEETGTDLEDVNIYRTAVETGVIELRVNLLLDHSLIDLCAKSGITSPRDIEKGRLRICGIKFYADGSLGGRTAALKEPYSDDPSNYGVLHMDAQQMTELFTKAHKAGLQCCTHAIGDRAIETVLKANRESYEVLDMSEGSLRDRIEHCQIMDEDLIEGMKRQDMIASIQFSFAASDSPWAEGRVGERIKTSYAWKTLMEKGIRCCGGTDAPVESYVPLEGIEKIVLRRDNPSRSLTLEQAIKLYTIDGAYAQWQESYLGSLEEGKLADLVVLSGDIMETESSAISELMVDMTMVDGKIVYERL